MVTVDRKVEISEDRLLKLCKGISNSYLRYSNKKDAFFCRHCKSTYSVKSGTQHEKGCIVPIAIKILNDHSLN